MRFRQVSSIVLGLLACASGAPLEQNVEIRQLIPSGLVNLNFTRLNAHFDLLTLLTNTAHVDFDIAPIIPNLSLLVGISITNITLSAGIAGTEYISFTHGFDTPLAVPLTGSVNSGTISGVSLTQGALPTLLNAFPSKTMDIFSAGVSMRNISAHFTAASLLNNQLSRVDFNVAPVLSLLSILETVTIDSVTLTAVSGTTTIFTINKTFDPALQVPTNGSVSSGVFINVPLTQGSAATLSAVNSGTLTANGQFNTHVTIITSPLTLPLPLTTIDSLVPTAWSISFF
ncbi:hypothetical protein EYR40_010431 [Pleurotus pulmonarius]|nr:hypothetical protein EYR36_010181 [Pleurotus pulmonarius]KAF4588876.1 hypothetical protein EYR40_010431 [Pleurotus pulmonarius]